MSAQKPGKKARPKKRVAKTRFGNVEVPEPPPSLDSPLPSGDAPPEQVAAGPERAAGGMARYDAAQFADLLRTRLAVAIVPRPTGPLPAMHNTSAGRISVEVGFVSGYPVGLSDEARVLINQIFRAGEAPLPTPGDWLDVIRSGPAAAFEAGAELLKVGDPWSLKTNVLTFIGNLVSKAVRRELLLRTLNSNRWHLAGVAEELGLGDDAAPVIRAIKDLGLVPEYEAARADGRIVRGGVRVRPTREPISPPDPPVNNTKK